MISTLFLLLVLPLLIGSLMPLLPWQTIWTDMPSHFVQQYFIAAVLLIPFALWADASPRILVLLGFVLLLNFAHLLPYLPTGGMDGAKKAIGTQLKILQANVYKYSADPQPLRSLIEKENPDIVALAEVNSTFASIIETLRPEYPHQEVIVSDTSSFGMALISKRPFTKITRHYFAKDNIPSIEAEIILDEKTIRILSLHPANPTKDMAARDAEFAAVAENFAGKSNHLVITGDLNATPWCPAMKKLMKKLNLENARRGAGILGTFHADAPLGIFRLPIDHALIGRDLIVKNHHIGADIGSDHLPTLTTIALLP